MNKILESLSPLERKIVPLLALPIEEIEDKAGLDRVSLLRGLSFLEKKDILKIKQERTKIIELGVNGIYYKKNGLPERRFLTLLTINKVLSIQEAKKLSKLSDNEFKVSLGALKKKEVIEIREGKVFLKTSKNEIVQKTEEEILIEKLPLRLSDLNENEKKVLEELKSRKEIIKIKEEKETKVELTEIGKELTGKEMLNDLLEEVTPELIKNPTNKKFRRYDIQASVPKIKAGRRHFVNQTIEEGKRIWLDLGFKEMSGDYAVTSFWNFDALFTPQDHPVREMHDTFFIKKLIGTLPKKELVEKIKKAHETGIVGSKGWNYNWQEKEARKVLLRTHTTCLSAKTISELKKTDIPAKYFAIGKVFRNETVDWSHGFEFNQSEGIVIDPNANFRHLIGYLKQFAEKMGYKKLRIQPAYFPYTEPSLEGAVWNEEKKKWIEVLAAGIFRPEVTYPLLGITIPVLAWGPGFDRLMMAAHQIKDLRELYSNDIKKLREKKVLTK